MKIFQNCHYLCAILTISMLLSCNDNQDIKQKELDLKEKELNLKEREINLIEKRDSLKVLMNEKENLNSIKEDIQNNSRINIDVNAKDKINAKESLNEILKDDFNNLKVKELPKVWAKRYDLLPNKFKNTVYTDSGSYKLVNNESGVEELIRGFYWSCGNNDKMDKLGELISIDIGYNNTNLTYKSGMVFFYYKHQILNCIY